MFTRSPSALEDGIYDVLVIGGGIHGLGIAWDAALRGLRTALVERDDFGAGATAGCFRIVHGGLRYLQHLDISRLRSSVREQRTLRRIAPHFISPLPFLVPAYGYGKKGAEFLAAGLCLYEQLARDRNAGVDALRSLPNHEYLSRRKVLELFPGLPESGLRGGQVFYDAQMAQCERLTLAVAKAAAAAGASMCNYCEFKQLDQSETPLWTLQILDKLTGNLLHIRAQAVVNVGGSANADNLARFGFSQRTPKRDFVRGIQLVLPKMPSSYSLALESGKVEQASIVRRGGRSYFLVPWENSTLAGTYEEFRAGQGPAFRVEAEDELRFLEELRSAYRSELFQPSQVRASFGGFIPLERGSEHSGRHRVERDDEISVFGTERPFINISGVKYTTFRELAERSVDKLCALLKRGGLKSKTAETLLPGAGITSVPVSENAEQAHLQKIYGSEALEVLKLGLASPEALQFIEDETESSPEKLTRAKVMPVQVSYAVKAEMAVKLSDFLFRRSTLGLQGLVSKGQLGKLAAIMGHDLAWAPDRISAEISDVRALSHRNPAR